MLLMKDREILKMDAKFLSGKLVDINKQLDEILDYIERKAEYYEEYYGNTGEDYDLAMTGVYEDTQQEYDALMSEYEATERLLKETKKQLRCRLLRTEERRRYEW